MRRRLNLVEVGRLAGVSRSTVSRVLNGEPNVSPEVRNQVEAVIAETGYRPHAAARSLASNRTAVLGLMIPSAVETLFDDPYFGRLMLGATSAANQLDLTMALFLLDAASDEEALVPRVVNRGLVDGVIVTATRMGDPLIDQLARADVPFVVIGRPDNPDISSSVDADNCGGARSAAEHLAALGRTRIAMIGAPGNTSAGLDRRHGFIEGLEARGLELAKIVEGSWTEESGRSAMSEILDTNPDAVFVASDRMAVGALRAIADAGLRCPDDLSLVAFDGLLPADRTRPSLTSVAQPVQEVGHRAVELLGRVIAGEITTPEHILLSTELVVRESCGAGAEFLPTRPKDT